MGRRGPSDQVTIDGPQSSSTSGQDEQGGNPSSPRGLLMPWGGDEGTQRSSVSSTRGGGGGSPSGLMTYTSMTRLTTWWCSMESRLRLPW
jgi:hypothetical protein